MIFVALTMSGCQNANKIIGSCDQQEPAIGAYGTIKALHIQPGDKLKITVFGEEQLNGEYYVDLSGDLSIPLSGTIHAAGLTRLELSKKIAAKLKKGDYFVRPEVTVDISSFRPFYVLGEVDKPGEYPYQASLNVESAIAIAGGETYRANEDTILIQRLGEVGFRECPMSPKILVYPGDIVRVPERYF